MLYQAQALRLQAVGGQGAEDLAEALRAVDQREGSAPAAEISRRGAELVQRAVSLLPRRGAPFLRSAAAAPRGEVRGIRHDEVDPARLRQGGAVPEVAGGDALRGKAVRRQILPAERRGLLQQFDPADLGRRVGDVQQHGQHPRPAAEVEDRSRPNARGEMRQQDAVRRQREAALILFKSRPAGP